MPHPTILLEHTVIEEDPLVLEISVRVSWLLLRLACTRLELELLEMV